MSGLFSILNNSLDALRAFQMGLEVSQNNVSNASTPGYARQVTTFQARQFDPVHGLGGGVVASQPQSTDNQYADQAVRSQFEQQGSFTAQANALQAVQGLFDVNGGTGIVGSLNNLFQSFSTWGAEPGSLGSAQAVLKNASSLAKAFRAAAATLNQTTNNLNGQIRSSVDQINTIGAQIQKINQALQGNPHPDAGLQANLQASLDSLSQLTDSTVRFESDGTATVLIGGQVPLVIGTELHKVQASFTDPNPGPNANAIQDAHILDADGNDVTSLISGGALGGYLNVRNSVLPGLQGNGTQQGVLNELAQHVADRVNQILTSAQTTGGQPGAPLFAYNTGSPVDVAATLTLDPNITAAGLAPTDPGPPPVANGAALKLATLGNSTAAGDQIGGQSILQFIGSIAAQAGQQASDAETGATLSGQLLAQAKSLQTQISGVSLDVEALQVLELQKGYDAAGKMIGVVSQLTQTLIDMVR